VFPIASMAEEYRSVLIVIRVYSFCPKQILKTVQIQAQASLCTRRSPVSGFLSHELLHFSMGWNFNLTSRRDLL
jgi:hypothetical protein